MCEGFRLLPFLPNAWLQLRWDDLWGVRIWCLAILSRVLLLMSWILFLFGRASYIFEGGWACEGSGEVRVCELEWFMRRLVIAGCMPCCRFMRRMCLGLFLGRMLAYLFGRHITLVSKFWGGGWKEVVHGLCVFSSYMIYIQCSLSMVIVPMYAHVWWNINVSWDFICLVGCVACMSLSGLHSRVLSVSCGPLMRGVWIFVSIVCGMLKTYGYSFILFLLYLVWRILFINERLWLYMRVPLCEDVLFVDPFGNVSEWGVPICRRIDGVWPLLSICLFLFYFFCLLCRVW